MILITGCQAGNGSRRAGNDKNSVNDVLAQGIEFVLPEEFVFPDDYPKPGAVICVAGEFSTYTEHGTEYCTLKNAKLIEGGV